MTEDLSIVAANFEEDVIKLSDGKELHIPYIKYFAETLKQPQKYKLLKVVKEYYEIKENYLKSISTSNK